MSGADQKGLIEGLDRDQLLDFVASDAKPCYGCATKLGPIMTVGYEDTERCLTFSVKPFTSDTWQKVLDNHEAYYRRGSWRNWKHASLTEADH